MMSYSPPGIIFVGGFRATRNNMWGGQVQACRSLLNEAKTATDVRWFLVDTTMRTIPPPSIVVRTWDAFLRVSKFVGIILTRRIHGVLIFSDMYPCGLLEKGMMCLIGRLFGKRVVLAPRAEVKKFCGAAGIMNAFARCVLRACTGVICQSEEAKESLRADFHCPEFKLHHVPAWIDFTPYESLANRRTVPAPNSPTTFLYLGWFITEKGIFELLTAFEGVRRKCERPCRLILCGDGGERNRMVARVAELNLTGEVEFRGWVDLEGKLRALGEADIFVFPSYSEGLPNALMEAMAAGLPCITTPVGGIPSLIQHEVSGLFIPPKDSEALEAAMLRFIGDQEFSSKLAARGMIEVKRNHQVAGAFERIADMLGIPIAEADGSEKIKRECSEHSQSEASNFPNAA